MLQAIIAIIDIKVLAINFPTKFETIKLLSIFNTTTAKIAKINSDIIIVN